MAKVQPRVFWQKNLFAFALALGIPASASYAARLGVGIVQPKRYVSPSGEYSLFVDPGDRSGKGKAAYRFTRNGTEVWSAEHSYMLQGVTVTDKGLTAGFAYREGPKADKPEGVPRPVGGAQNPPEYLHVVVLDQAGRELLNDVTERIQPPYPSNPPSPLFPCLEQFVVDTFNDRIVARVMVHGEEWWTYALSTGQKLARVKSRELLAGVPNIKFAVDLRPVPGTALWLCQWYVQGPDDKAKDAGGYFTLMDLDFKVVWSFDTPNDYAALDLHKDVFMGLGPQDYFQENPATFVTADIEGAFGLRGFAENRQVNFIVARATDGTWNVTQIGWTGFVERAPGDRRIR